MKAATAYGILFLFTAAFFFSCKKEYSFEGGKISAGQISCSSTTIKGKYLLGRNMTDSNFWQIQVQVSSVGSYSIKSDTVNGYSFSGTGTFNSTGPVTLKLQAKGKPLATGTNFFTIHYDSIVCHVSITVQDTIINVVQTSHPDHFPLTDHSHWVYDDLTFPGDSIIRTVTGATITLNSVTHKIMDEYKSFYPATNKHYYRKNGDDYFRYASVSSFTSSFEYSPPIQADINFLKEGLVNGQIWYSDTWSGRTARVNEFVDCRYHFRCVNADMSITINGKTFIHVYKIEMRPEKAISGSPLVPTGEIHTSYYAKGVGLIYSEFFNTILSHPVMQLRSWVVN